MSYNIKKILSGLKDNIEGIEIDYINALADNYRDYASVVLILTYYLLYEAGESGEEDYKKKELLKYTNDISDIIMHYIVNGDKVDNNVLERIDNLRNLVINKLDLLLNYTGKLYIYEYILNRQEYNFEESLKDTTMSINDESFSKLIVEYIFSNNDNVVINNKIREVIGQLPIRMTKDRFYDLVMESMDVYKGSKVEGLESFVERIRSAATLTNEEFDEEYKILVDALKFYNEIDFKSLDKQTFDKAQEIYREVNVFVKTYTDFLSDVQRIINMTYTVLLTRYIQDNIQEDFMYTLEQERIDILDHLCKGYKSEYEQPIHDDISAKLVCVEGIQEKSRILYEQLESALEEDILELYVKEDNNIQEMITLMKKCSKLLSTSIFMDLNTIDDKELLQDVDDNTLKNKKEELLRDFKELFDTKQRVYTRAVMANVLSELPVFFVNMNEVVEYINTQVSLCKNNNEKMACYAIITDMISQD